MSNLGNRNYYLYYGFNLQPGDSHFTVKRMLSFGGSGDKLVSAITSDSPTINHKIMVGLFIGLDPLNPSSIPTSRIMNEIGDANTRYLVNEIVNDPSSTFRVFILVKDLLKNGGT
jgi:hypothetical protein